MAESIGKSNKARKLRNHIILHIILILGSITMLVPFLWMIGTSLKPPAEVWLMPPKLFGSYLNFEAYTKLNSRFDFVLYFMNSVKVSAWVVFFQVLTSCMAGYCFAKLHFPGRDKIFVAYLATMMVPFHITTITNFLTMTRVGLAGTHWALMIPPMVSAFGTFLLRQFFVSVPNSLMEAARIDGCSPFGIFFKIMLPLAGSSIATLAIFCFMGTWNDYFSPLIYITDARKYTLPIGLANLRGLYQTDWCLLMASCFISILPVLIAFLCAQDAFVKGVALSGMKD